MMIAHIQKPWTCW